MFFIIQPIKVFVFLAPVLVFLSVFQTELLPAEANRSLYVSESNKSVQKGIRSSWSSSSLQEPGKYTEITFGVANDGKIYNPFVLHFSNDDQYDAECLEAVCGLSPIVPQPKGNSAFLDQYTFSFGKDEIRPSYDANDIKQYLSAHPQPEHPSNSFDVNTPFVLFHRIPLDVLTRYPGMFQKEELFNFSNLARRMAPRIKDRNTVGGENKCPPPIQPVWVTDIANIYSNWTALFKRSKVTKAEILEQAKSIRTE